MTRRPLTLTKTADGVATFTPPKAAAKRTSPEPPVLATLVLDTSGSMEASGALAAAVAALPGFRDSVLKDERLSRCLEWSFLTFSDEVTVVREFGPIAEWEPPLELCGGSGTRMGSALLEALRLQEAHVAELTEKGIGHRYRFLMLITDGYPTGEALEVFDEAARQIQEQETKKGGRFTFYPIGVDNADFGKLSELTRKREPLKLASVDHFAKFMAWVVSSVSAVMRSRIGEDVEVPPALVSQDPSKGWGTVAG